MPRVNLHEKKYKWQSLLGSDETDTVLMGDSISEPCLYLDLDFIMPGTSKPHYHRTEQGTLVRCYHETLNTLSSFKFWAGVIISTTASFPFEHWLYEKVWPFYLLTEWMGL